MHRIPRPPSATRSARRARTPSFMRPVKRALGVLGVLGALLVLGLGGRIAALGLSVVNVVAVLSLRGIPPAALQQHITWGVLLAALALFGVGRWSVDGTRVQPWLHPVLNTSLLIAINDHFTLE